DRTQGEVVAQTRRLANLREQERSIRTALTDAEALRKALDLAKARSDETAAREHLASFPAELERATGEEDARIAELDERLGQLRARRDSVSRERDRASAEVEATRLEGSSINEGVIQALRSTRSELARIDQELDGLQRDVQSARA